MTSKPKVGQIWKNKQTNDKVKVMKILPGNVKLFDVNGSNYGKQFQEDYSKFIIKYRLVSDV